MSPPVILALDLATQLGWACAPANLPPTYRVCGSEPLPRDDAGRTFSVFSNWLADKITEHKVGVVAIEAPFVRAGMAFIRQARRAFGLAAVAQLVSWRRECAFMEIAAPTVRKAFCGNGRAEKFEVIAECKRRGWSPTDDNAADAIALLHVVPSRLDVSEAA